MNNKLDIPYVPSSEDRLEAMIELADIQQGQKSVDLGSGDGRVVIACAEAGAIASGFELEPSRVELARKKITEAGLDTKAQVHYRSFWEENLEDFDVITVYGITSIMEKLEAKLLAEVRPGAKIISNLFTFPNWEPETVKNSVYLYLKK